MALTLAGWFAVVVPCAALAQCASPAPVRSCCGKVQASCCCGGGEHRVPAPAPGVPAPRVAPDHAAELPAAGNELVTAALACKIEVALVFSSPIAAPTYLSACSFRC